jgi:lipopolysaccharide export system protein LptA
MRYIFLILLMMVPLNLMAQESQPVEITADEGLEWDRDAQLFTANGNAKIVQGTTVLKADRLIASYSDSADSIILKTVTATGGRPNVETGDETLTANKMVASFSDNNKGEIEKIVASGDVVIVTPEDTLKGDNAEYQPQNELAIVTGNVTITRGDNVLSGNRATFNMKTNVSKMEAADKGRVKAVFYPQSGNKK